MSFKTEIEDALGELRTELAGSEDDAEHGTLKHATFYYMATEIPCVPTQVMRGTVLDVGGKLVEADAAIRVLRSIFEDEEAGLVAPTAGKTLTYRSKSYHIGSVGEDASGAFYVLNLVDTHSGR